MTGVQTCALPISSDIAEFDKWKFQFDDFLKNGDLNPGFTMYKRYLDRVKARLDFALAELNKGGDSFDFTAKENLQIDRKKKAMPRAPFRPTAANGWARHPASSLKVRANTRLTRTRTKNHCS